ncbi:CCR4-Not complex component, Not1-domain-containing protein [Cladochytrium replicatum]|nr:CCR4-Not complex component, Not1-domain-containing protein [Cladochytrium replicatum]
MSSQGPEASVAGQSTLGIPLATLMQDLGYRCTGMISVFRRTLEEIGVHANNSSAVLRESDVARVLSMMSRTHSGLDDTPAMQSLSAAVFGREFSEMRKLQTWDVDVVISCLMENNPNLDWYMVFRHLDHQDFIVFDQGGLTVLLKAAKLVYKDLYQFPTNAFFGRWSNPKGQLSFLKQAIQFSSELFVRNQNVSRRIVFIDASITNSNVRTMIQNWSTLPWNLLDLLEALLGLSESGFYEDVKVISESACQQSPELVAMGLAQIREPWNSLHKELTASIVHIVLGGNHPHWNFVVARLWQTSQKYLMNMLLTMYAKDPTSITRALDVAQEVKALAQILESQPYGFSIDLAALASRRDFLNLEKWLLDHIRQDGDTFIKACLDFLNEKVASQIWRQESVMMQTVPLSPVVIETFIKILTAHSSTMSAENSEYFREILTTIETSGEENTNGEKTKFSPDVEAEANSYYERIYKGVFTISNMVEVLQNFKVSSEPRKQEVYKCMVHSLLEEYRWFTTYPEKELAITSVLFGALIQNQLFTLVAQWMALRYVLDALRQPVGSLLFKFGSQALAQFQGRLPEWPQYCSLLLQIPHLPQALPQIISNIKTIQKQSGPENHGHISGETAYGNSSEAAAQNGAQSGNPSTVFTALQLDSSLSGEKDYPVPPEEVQDQILFIVNNVSFTNLETKVAEMSELLSETYLRWFGYYLVDKRASQEPNFHNLYLELLDKLKFQQLNKYVLHETYASIHVLLNSDKTVELYDERKVLKTLGTWLGSQTLARNRPIKQKYLSIKDLLLEGHDKQRLIVVIPFVCKVLEQCATSRVFKPPNPWLMAIMKLMAELYQFGQLKSNLIFEIEILCKKINLEITGITPTTLLRNRPLLSTPATSSAAQPILPSVPTPVINPAAPLASSQDESSVGFPNLASFITFNPNIPIFNTQPSLRRIVHIAIDRAIREIITPVVERSVTIASIASRELVIKDFALEPNEEKMRKAGQLMVQSLAGSLASVTCREPVRISITSHMRTLLLQNGFSEQTVPEQAIYVTVQDNLDLACSVIEKTAAEKAVPEIDEALGPAFLSRRKHRERTTQPYYDMQVYAGSRYPSSLPESLRLKPGGLTQQQLRTYEDFARLPRHVAEERARGGVPVANRIDPRQEAIGMYGMQPIPPQTFEDPSGPLSHQLVLEKFSALITELGKLLLMNSNLSLASLPPQHDITALMRQIPILVAQSINRDETALLFSQKIMSLIYKDDSPLAREAFVLLLDKLCELSKKVAREVTGWLLYADDERKYNVPVTISFIQQRLIGIQELDQQLARLIESGRLSLIDFTVKLIRKCILEDPPLATQHDFFNTIDLMSKLVTRTKAPELEPTVALLEDLRKRTALLPLRDGQSKDGENSNLREPLAMLFTEWVRLFVHPASNEKAHAQFILQLQQQGIPMADDVSILFFRVCTELSVENYLKQKLNNAPPVMAAQAVDAFARLIVLLVRYHPDQASGSSVNVAKHNLVTKMLSIIVLVLVHAHEQKRNFFNPKPFLRLFSTLLNDLHANEQHLQPIYFEILSAISNTFHTLQPGFLPGFTFSWLQLISHRHFMPKLLMAENQRGWPFFQRLMADLFKFLQPFLRQGEMTEPLKLLYKGTLRILLVLLHDVPEFLCDYHFSFVDVIPHNCIQLRNLILSAFPRNMKLPDPFTPNLRVENLPEITHAPTVLSDYTSTLVQNGFKQDIDLYLKSRGPVSFLIDLRNRLVNSSASQSQTGFHYNIQLINSLVLYVGVQAIAQSQGKQGQGIPAIAPSPSMDIFQQLVVDLDTEGRYFFLSAIANQLRYPNSHTHYFSCVLLYLFSEANQEIIQEQITRVLLERLIVNRPHPYGLLITFIELIRNSRYNFWEHTNFIRCAPDIERLFTSVAKSINAGA